MDERTLLEPYKAKSYIQKTNKFSLFTHFWFFTLARDCTPSNIHKLTESKNSKKELSVTNQERLAQKKPF